jgi:hypothetical protein
VDSIHGTATLVQDAWRGKLPQSVRDYSDEDIARVLGASGVGMAGGIGRAGARASTALGSGPTRNKPNLPMDEASRTARAKEMGFMTDLPLYHGTAAPDEIRAFGPSRQGEATGSLSARQGVWTTPDPDEAARYADNAATRDGAGDPRTVPLRGRSDRMGRIGLEGSETDGMVAATLQDAWEAGFDAVTITTKDGRSTIVFRHPNQLRLPWARFDPAQRDSADLDSHRHPIKSTATSANEGRALARR